MNDNLPHLALRAAVIQAVGSSLAPLIQLSASRIPTMANAATILGPAIRAACTHATVALTDTSIVSDLDTATAIGSLSPSSSASP